MMEQIFFKDIKDSMKIFATYGDSSYFKVLSSCIFSLTSVRGGPEVLPNELGKHR